MLTQDPPKSQLGLQSWGPGHTFEEICCHSREMSTSAISSGLSDFLSLLAHALQRAGRGLGTAARDKPCPLLIWSLRVKFHSLEVFGHLPCIVPLTVLVSAWQSPTLVSTFSQPTMTPHIG